MKWKDLIKTEIRIFAEKEQTIEEISELLK